MNEPPGKTKSLIDRLRSLPYYGINDGLYIGESVDDFPSCYL